MSRRGDPQRLRTPGSSASEAARALLEKSRAELPDTEQLARLAQRLPRLGGGGSAPKAPAEGSPLGPPAPAGLAAAVSIVASVVVGAVLGLAVIWGASQREAAAPSTAAPLRPLPAAPHVVARELPAGAPASPAPSTATPEAPDPPRRPAPSASQPASAPSSRAAVAASSLGGSPAGAEGPLPVDAETELDVLRRAQQLLPHHPAEALAAAEEHRRRFPGGSFAQEREVIAVSALVALGRRDEAQGLARRFAESFPRSAHRAGVEELVRDPAAGRLDRNGAREGTPTP